ncbi:MAG: LamG domain-containing protein [Clostridia bacterium]|nr:LamG domain-containing protein [Clostridia bacterium]
MEHKKIFLFLILGMLLLIPMVAAVKIDYLPNDKGVNDMKVSVQDTILFGLIKTGEQGNVELKSHSRPDEVLKVGVGSPITMYYDFNFKDLYKEGLGDVTFINMKNGAEVNRNYKYVYWFEEERTREVCSSYEEVKLINDTKTLDNYSTSLVNPKCLSYEKETYTFGEWRDYNSKDIPKGIIRIGIQVDSRNGDYIDGIWEVQGKTIDRHASWTAALNNSLVSYYKLDEISGSVIDSVGSNTGTNNGATTNVAGKINTAYDFDGTNDKIVYSGNLASSSTTLSTWFKFTESGIYRFIELGGLTTVTNSFMSIVHEDGILGSIRDDAGHTVSTSAYTGYNDGNWHMATLTEDGTNIKLYVDGNLLETKSISTIGTQTFTSFNIGVYQGSYQYFSGTIDEVGIWSRALTPSEVELLYNDGDGLALYHQDAVPEIELNQFSPENDATLNIQEVDFIFNVTDTDTIGIQNVSLVINDTIYQTNTSGLEGNYTMTETLDDGYYSWRVQAYDNDSMLYESGNRTLTIDTTPFIQFEDPTPANDTNLSVPYIPVNVSLTETYFENVTFDFYKDGVLNHSETFTDETRFYNFTGCTCANWEFNVTTCTSTGKCNSTETRLVHVDILPPEITIDSPEGTYDYLYVGQELDLNFTAIDVGQGGVDSCWYDYNGTNYSIACTNATLASTQFAQEENNFNITVYANDTFGNEGSETQTWSTEFLEINRVYDANSLQTGTENFIWVSTKDSDVTGSSATFTYDGNSYTSIRTTSGTQVNFSNTIDIPVDLSGAIPFYWTVSFTNSTGSFEFNTSTTTQTVYNLTLEECFSPSIDGLTLNFTTYDSTNMTPIDSTLEATFQFYAGSGSGDLIQEFLFSDLNENRSNYMYCLESSGENVTVDAFISYGATDHDNREYIIDDGIIGNFTQDIPLYLTLTELTDIVTITVQDQTYNPLTGALVAVQRWNVGTNTYSTIGMFTTSSTGNGIMDLELYNTWYRGVVTYNEEIVEVTDVQKLSSTSWIITVDLGATNPYDLFGDISHGLTFDNETNITSFTWIDTSGYTSRGCFVVKNQTNLGPVTIEDECVQSVSGTIDYLLSGDGSYTAYGVIFLEGYDVSQIVDTLSIQLGTPQIIKTVSPRGKVISFIMVGTMGVIGVAAGSAILGVFLIIAVLIGLMYFGFLNITWGFIWGIISIGLLIIFLQRRKR